jgi:3-oxoadipate enol-lactonase
MSVIKYNILNPLLSPTLLFVHGIAANMNFFNLNIEHFKDRYRIITLSLRGHGDSLCPEDECAEAYTVDKMAEDIMDVVRECGVDSFHYIGHSMGGMIGYRMLGKYPEFFRSIITTGSAGEVSIPAWLAKAGTAPLKVLPQRVKKDMAVDFVVFLSGKTSVSRKFLKKEIVPFINWEAMRYCLLNLSNFSYLDILDKTNVPVYVIHGSRDPHNINLGSTLKLMEGRENFSYSCIKGGGHNANLDYPDEFNKLVEEFLNKQ